MLYKSERKKMLYSKNFKYRQFWRTYEMIPKPVLFVFVFMNRVWVPRVLFIVRCIRIFARRITSTSEEMIFIFCLSVVISSSKILSLRIKLNCIERKIKVKSQYSIIMKYQQHCMYICTRINTLDTKGTMQLNASL